MISDELIKVILLGFGALAGYFLKHYLDRSRESEMARRADRRDHYRNLVLCLKSLSDGKRDHDDLLRFEYSFLWLYAPDSVIRSFNQLLRRLNSQADTPLAPSEVGELILAMRRDLGFERTQLSTTDFDPSTR